MFLKSPIIYVGDFFMIQIQIFDEENENDLVYEVNKFLKTIDDNLLLDIKYSISTFVTASNEQVYCYSALIVYKVVIK